MATSNMPVCRWQTVEDGPPREGIDRWLKHEGHVTEHVLVAIPVRHPVSHQVMRTHVVIRASQATEDVTVALELYEYTDDGA